MRAPSTGRRRAEPPVRTNFGGTDVYGCGPWCQVSMLLQELNIVEGLDLATGLRTGGADPRRVAYALGW